MTKRIICGTAGALVLQACTSGQVGSLPNIAATNVQATSVLQFAVGTARIGLFGGGTVIGLNTVETFRGRDGQNATLVNTPTITGPAQLDKNHTVGGTLPSTLAADIGKGIGPTEDFGPFVGAFGYGLAPDNLLDIPEVLTAYAFSTSEANQFCFGAIPRFSLLGGANLGASSASGSQFQPSSLVVPVWGNIVRAPSGIAAAGCLQNQGSVVSNPPPSSIGSISGIAGSVPTFQYYGGPPAWPSAGYGHPLNFSGFPIGFTDFSTAPLVGTYQLDVAYPSTPNGLNYTHITATANLARASALPAFATPQVRVQNDGSAFVDVDIPPGVSEAMVFVRTDSCSSNTTPAQQAAGLGNTPPPSSYTLLFSGQFGRHTALLSANLGPADATGKPTHTFCTAADDRLPGANTNHGYDVIGVGFDYPAFEASYPQSSAQAPAITNGDGHTGQADITTSTPVYDQLYTLQ